MNVLRKTVLAMCVVAGALLGADNPFVGSWKMNADKSDMGKSGIKPVASATVESDGAGLKVTVDSEDAQGQPVHWTYSATLDGKPGTINGYPYADTIMLKRVNDRTLTATAKKDGKVVYSDHRVISDDGKTMTMHRTGTTPKGEKYKATLVFDRQ